ncbi:ParB N-terminal domain-containing protein [Shewanella fidelis]|uniref:ParB N-terminal domain-containing protein n=1 Tax=Shewanella fidelis TaxID=173509 RepID=UPI0004B58B40|nr:ParB N-terminal domain-containing protein [Shewanella fidelis]
MEEKLIQEEVNEIRRVLNKLGMPGFKLTDGDKVRIYNEVSAMLYKFVSIKHPVLNVQLVERDNVLNNDFNPNKVAPPEYKLLKHSILTDGVTMPVVVGSPDLSGYVEIIDGYHRSKLVREHTEIADSLKNYIPVVAIERKKEERISASVRHNMARGAHQVELTANLVIKLKGARWSDEKIGTELGMDPDEVLRMQQLTGLAEAFADRKYSKAWE